MAQKQLPAANRSNLDAPALQLDVSFGEDQNRTRKDHAAANLGALRRTSVSLLKNETTAKVGIKNKRMTAAWDTGYLHKVLFGT